MAGDSLVPFTNLQVFIKLNLTVHIRIDFAKNFMQLLTSYFDLTVILQET